MLYVVHVRGGYELRGVEELRQKGIAAYSPRQLCAERQRGEWRHVERNIFSGYVFVEIPELTAETWHKIMDCTGTVRILSRHPLPPDEDKYITQLCNSGYCISVSRGYVLDGVLHITSGFVKQFEHRIIKFNRRGKRAAADVTIYGKHHKIIFSVEFDDPPALP